MANPPFRDRVLSPEEVRRAIERAASLSKVDVAAGKSGERVTAAELERHLRELGIDGDVVRRAMEPAVAEEQAPAGTGGIVCEVVVDGALSTDDFEALAEEIDAAMRMPGRTSAVGHKLVWTPAAARVPEPSLTVHVKDGATRIRFHEPVATRAQLKVSYVVAGSLAGLMTSVLSVGAGAVAAQGLDVTAAQGGPFVLAAGALLGVAAGVGAFVGLGRMLDAQRRKRQAFADGVVAQVAAAVRGRVERAAPRARVEADASDEVEREHIDAAAKAERARG